MILQKKITIVLIKISSLIIFFLLFPLVNLLAQQDYNKFYRTTDPARDSSNLVTKKILHESFLKTALEQKDTLKIILGNLYLTDDFMIGAEYISAMDHLIQANDFASKKRDTLLLGRINHKKGSVYSFLDNFTKAIDHFDLSLSQSKIAKDSQFIAITLEQLGQAYSCIKDFKTSNNYYQQAIPMVKKFCSPSSLSVSLNNYGNSLNEQDSLSKAIQVYQEAIAVGEVSKSQYRIIPAKQNLALVYAKNDSLKKALNLYYECKQANEQNGWLDFLIYSYDGLSLTYNKLGNTDSALYYFQKFHFLKDSVIGAEVNNRVSQLEKSAEIHKKNIKILTQKGVALNYKNSLKNTIIIALTVLTLISWIAWYFFYTAKKTKLRLAESRSALNEVTSLLAVKNAELRNLASQFPSQSNSPSNQEQDESIEDINFYDMNILTDSDWQTFKALFEKSYPNYLQKIRDQFPDISQAEVRLFLFIKLQLSSKESANILGVQPNTIKKNRNRLRKRLGLEQEENLNKFIQKFK